MRSGSQQDVPSSALWPESRQDSQVKGSNPPGQFRKIWNDIALSDFQSLNIRCPYKDAQNKLCLARQDLGHTHLAHGLECVSVIDIVIGQDGKPELLAAVHAASSMFEVAWPATSNKPPAACTSTKDF